MQPGDVQQAKHFCVGCRCLGPSPMAAAKDLRRGHFLGKGGSLSSRFQRFKATVAVPARLWQDATRLHYSSARASPSGRRSAYERQRVPGKVGSHRHSGPGLLFLTAFTGTNRASVRITLIPSQGSAPSPMTSHFPQGSASYRFQ